MSFVWSLKGILKSSLRYTLTSLRECMAKYHNFLSTPYVIHAGDVKEEEGILFLPLHMMSLVLFPSHDDCAGRCYMENIIRITHQVKNSITYAINTFRLYRILFM